MRKTQYLQRLGQTWYLRVKIPRELQGKFRNTHVRKALRTRDLDEAVRLKWAALAQIRAHFDELLGRRHSVPPSIAGLSHFGSVSCAVNCNNSPSANLQSIAPFQRSSGLDQLAERWAESGGVTKTVSYQRRQVYAELRAHLGGDKAPESINLSTAAEYVDEVLARSPDSPGTRRRKLSALGALWEWAGSRGFVQKGLNPWRGFRLKLNDRKAPRKRPYTSDELIKIFSGSPTYPALREVMVLALFTGARIDELCSLRQGDIRWDSGSAFVRIARAKTAAGVRTIAICHPTALAVLRSRYCANSEPNSQLFHELKGGGYDKRLSWHVGQAFRYHRNKQALTGETDFHSFRRTFITRLENLSVDQVHIARYVGHSMPTLAFKVYSGGATEATQMATGRAITYPAEVERTIDNFLGPALLAGPPQHIDKRTLVVSDGPRLPSAACRR